MTRLLEARGELTYLSQEGVLRDCGIQIGKNIRLRSGTIIYPDVVIGDNFTTGHNVLIREYTAIGNDVLVGTNSVIEGHCEIGDRVIIQTGVCIVSHTNIDDGAFLGPGVVTTNSRHMNYRSGDPLEGCHIKMGARIGANATLLPGVVIGVEALVGAGAVVTRDVPDGAVFVGNPARPLASLVRMEVFSEVQMYGEGMANST